MAAAVGEWVGGRSYLLGSLERFFSFFLFWFSGSYGLYILFKLFNIFSLKPNR